MTDLRARRLANLGPNVPAFYRTPLHIVRGEGVWLWDADGRRYLDAYNNVPHVGHCHPRVVAAIAEQAATLNTHTRYLHESILHLTERLARTLGADLTQAIYTCTGSEANDIALRMAQAVTGATGIIATDNTYHGNTMALSQLSTRRPPIGGRWPNVRLVPAPETGMDPEMFAGYIAEAIRDLQSAGFGFSGMMLCPVFANEGLPDLPRGWLDPAVRAIRKAEGLILCDEVQSGMGRLGSHWWGFQALRFTPDVVTMGKPMGNGHPIAATFAKPEVMGAFREAFGYFNTFGGNPVSCAAAHAVLDVLEDEGLLAHASHVSAHLNTALRKLTQTQSYRVTSRGQMHAIELETGARAADVIEHMKDNGVLIGTIGRVQHILKIRPPMPFGIDHSDQLTETLAKALDACP